MLAIFKMLDGAIKPFWISCWADPCSTSYMLKHSRATDCALPLVAFISISDTMRASPQEEGFHVRFSTLSSSSASEMCWPPPIRFWEANKISTAYIVLEMC